MGAFPNLSRNVPFCPRLYSFVLLGARTGDKSGRKRTNGDKTGHFGTNWETPPFSIYPHLAFLNTFSALKGGVALQVASWKLSRHRGVSRRHCRLSSTTAKEICASHWGVESPSFHYPILPALLQKLVGELFFLFAGKFVRGFEKGLADRGVGTRQSLPYHRLRPFFGTLFPMLPPYVIMRRRTQF